MSERWDGPDGQWAAFRTSYSWGPSNRIQAAWLSEDIVKILTTLVDETVTALRVKSEDGEWLEEPGPDTWERINAAAGDALVKMSRENWQEWRKRRDPKGSEPTSAGSSSA